MYSIVTSLLLRCLRFAAQVSIVFFSYFILLTVYNLYLHPLRKFPGAKAAAATYWYEFYYDAFHNGGGQYFKKVKEMHRAYGPIVRVTPNELHIDDPTWLDTYCGKGSNQIREKYPPAAKMAGTTVGIFATVDSEKHRQRRSAIAHFFSKQSIRTIEPMLWSKLEKLCQTLYLQASQNEDGVVELLTPFLAFATDVVCDFALGASPHQELLLSVERQEKWRHTINDVADTLPIGKHFSWCTEYAKLFPIWMLKRLWPAMGGLMEHHESMREVARDMILGRRDQTSDSKTPKNVFEAILHSNLPEQEKSQERLADEGFELISAGGDTVARNASAAIFNLLHDASVMEEVRRELKHVFEHGPEDVTLQILEGLPWLGAVLKETMRLQAVITSRLPLVSPHQGVRFKEWIIPPGTPFSMSLIDVLHDPDCFNDPLSFKPQRWLPGSDEAVNAQKYWIPFSRGTRVCLGLNLAHSELYLIVANVLARFEVELYQTTRERDMIHARDCFIGKPQLSSQGVRVKLQPRTIWKS